MIIGAVRLYFEGLASTLARHEEIAVVAAISALDATIERLRAAAAEVIIVDVQSNNLLQLLSVIRRECSSAKVVAFAVDARDDSLIICAEHGVEGYLTCDASSDELARVIHTVVDHEFVCPPNIAATLVRRLAMRVRSGGSPDRELLTGREREVLALVCEGLSNKEIAQTCGISEATVKNHVHHLLEKHKLRTRGQLAARLAGAPGAIRVPSHRSPI
jgi:DNA-binding NarL/FixJ family response regulator